MIFLDALNVFQQTLYLIREISIIRLAAEYYIARNMRFLYKTTAYCSSLMSYSMICFSRTVIIYWTLTTCKLSTTELTTLVYSILTSLINNETV